MKKLYWLLMFVIGIVLPSCSARAATTPISFTGSNYTQNFDTLPNTGTFSFTGTGPFDVPSLPGWQFYQISGSGASANFTVDNGSGTKGSAYSYGTTGATDRALGSLASSSMVPRIGAILTNSTASTTFTSFTLSYTGEQWRNGGSNNPNTLTFSYALGATDISPSTGFSNVPALNFTSPVSSTTTAALNGNVAPNRSSITSTVSLPGGWAPGQTLVIRWDDADDKGSDDGLAVDDLTLSAIAGTPSPSIVTSTGSLTNFGKIAVGSTSAEQTYTVSGSNLTNDITITAPTDFQISTTTGTGFGTTLTLPQSGGTVATTTIYVRYAPTTTGPNSGSITHTSTGATTQNVTVSGTGLAAEPTAQATNITFTGVGSNSLTVNWTTGNGTSRIVLARAGSAVTTDPTDGTSYTANSSFGANSSLTTNSQLGVGNFVVYAGTGNSVTVTNLAPGDTCFFSVYEYNGSGGTENYLTPPLTGSQATTTNANPTTVVISQVFGGGGNSGASFTNDYVELYNFGAAPIDLTGWSIQYASATGAFGGTGNTMILSGAIQPQKYFLIQENSNAAVGSALPTPDATGNIGLSSTSGKVALLSNSNQLTTNNPATDPQAANVVDFVGYGTVDNAEGGAANAAPTLSNTTADFRNYTANPPNPDTNNNKADFTAQAPKPRNSSYAATFVTLIAFTATRYSNILWLTWQTGWEVDNLGFNVYRETKGKKVRLNGATLIAGSALQMGTQDGFNYAWPDTLQPGAKYWLEDVDTHGKSTWHGPIAPCPGVGSPGALRRSPLLGQMECSLLAALMLN